MKEKSNYGNLPIYFEGNEGQMDQAVRFIRRGAGYTLFLTADGMVITVQSN